VYDLKPLTLGPYEYPTWSQAVGWLIRLSSMAMIPIYAVIEPVRGRAPDRENRVVSLPEQETVYHLAFCETGTLSERVKKSLHIGVVLTKPEHHREAQRQPLSSDRAPLADVSL